MLAPQVAKKYATALFHLARDRGLIDQASDQFAHLDQLLVSDATLVQFLLAPHIREQEKTALLRTVFGNRLEPLFLEFLLLLVDKHRIGFLHDIIIHFRALVAEERGLIIARVITAVPLSETERRDLVIRLRRKTGKIVELDEKVESSILGGMIVILKDKIIDGSVRHKLTLLKEELLKLKVA